jgi:pSer/pThr/pTyr-binding forkhead associated (FHA) protein
MISRRPAKYAKTGNRKQRRRGKTDSPKRGFIVTIVDGPNEGQESFFEKEAILGRVEECDVLVIEPGISRRHARIFDDHGIFMLEDLGSANGTRLNGQKIEAPEVLRDGDYLSLSATTFMFSALDGLRGEATAETQLSDTEQKAVDVSREGERPKKRGFLRSTWGKLLIVFLVLGIGAAVGFKLYLRSNAKEVVSDLSGVPLSYSESDAFFNAVYGYGRYDKSHPNRVVIHFEYLGDRATVQYGAWGVDKVGEVEILLNGRKVGAVPLTMQRWVYGLKLVLPKDKLRKSKVNELIFNNTRNPPARDTWEICYVQLLQEAIPPPDPKEARHRFELAKKAWEDREVEPSNAYAALVGFEKARDLLEALPEKPPLYQEALDYIEKADKELTKRFQEGLFSAHRARKYGNVRKARHVLIRTLRYFRKEDFRHRELQRYLSNLAKGS